MPTPSDALPTFSCLNRWRCNDHRLLWTFAPAALVWPLYFFVMATLESESLPLTSFVMPPRDSAEVSWPRDC
jgi:hypothetical protein